MNALKGFAAIIYFFIVLPMWYYLIFSVLKKTGVDDMVWGIFWAYLPVSFLTSAIMQLPSD